MFFIQQGRIDSLTVNTFFLFFFTEQFYFKCSYFE